MRLSNIDGFLEQVILKRSFYLDDILMGGLNVEGLSFKWSYLLDDCPNYDLHLYYHGGGLITEIIFLMYRVYH